MVDTPCGPYASAAAPSAGVITPPTLTARPSVTPAAVPGRPGRQPSPHRAVWIPAGVVHAHCGYGPTGLRAVSFAPAGNPLRLDRPAVLAVTPLPRGAVACLIDDTVLTGDARRRRDVVHHALTLLAAGTP
ncbi:hypothetical protein [Streptomyces sp. 130]|uniref:hypothetical protein n=1 Tax=Streptomyces sp. 130 TaxID=2591006 RepID=UPI0021B0DA74|nr:hypothetical protein [Streptomyces sp. 130]